MKANLIVVIGAYAAMSWSLSAQSLARRASFVGGGNPGAGRCTVEVVVDGAAEVEIRGDNAVLRNLQGQIPQWRRFECTGPLPANPGDFRFVGIDGRGRQQLVRDPRSGGAAVVRIEDPDNGQEGYTFDIRWGGIGPMPGRGDGRGDGPGPGRRWTTDQAVHGCQDAVRQQAGGRFNIRDVDFLATKLDDNPGRNDWVIGTLAVRRGDGRRDVYRFSCSVNFDSGQVRSARIEPAAEAGGRDGDRRSGPDRAMDNCRHGVEDRLRGDGFDRIDFRTIRADDRPNRNDWIVGTVRAEGRGGRADFYEFSCSVSLRDGDLRSVDVRRPGVR